MLALSVPGNPFSVMYLCCWILVCDAPSAVSAAAASGPGVVMARL